MKLGVALPTVGLDHSPEFLLDVAEAAERGGLDSVWATDHVVLSYERESRYPYGRSGTEVAMNPGMQWIDPLTTLSFVAARSERLRLGTSVLVLPYRNPVLLAAQAASLQVLSEGRFVLGVGAGWMREEFEALGLDPAERGARTDEHIEVLRALWRDDPASFDGRFTRFGEIVLAISPGDDPPPIWVGGNSDPALRRAARLGDGWHGFEVYPDEVAAIRERISSCAADAGRDPAGIELSVVRGLIPPGREEEGFIPDRRNLGAAAPGEPCSAESVAAELRAYADEGVSLVVVQIGLLAPLMPEAIDWLAAEVLPALRL